MKNKENSSAAGSCNAVRKINGAWYCDTIVRKGMAFFAVMLVCCSAFCSSIRFSGGYTSVDLQEENRVLVLSGGAGVWTDDAELTADTIRLFGEDYKYIECTGKIKIRDLKNNITVNTPYLYYDREENVISADGWIEIEDPDHDATLSGGYLEYDMNSGKMEIQMKASITKDNEDTNMKCTSDVISFDSKTQNVTLKGNAKVEWGEDSYGAAMINVNLDTEEIELHGSISGTING